MDATLPSLRSQMGIMMQDLSLIHIFPRGNGKGNIVYRGELPIPFGEVLYLDHGIASHSGVFSGLKHDIPAVSYQKRSPEM